MRREKRLVFDAPKYSALTYDVTCFGIGDDAILRDA
jgi:hypothetical protein